jgi:hypothetical protein
MARRTNQSKVSASPAGPIWTWLQNGLIFVPPWVHALVFAWAGYLLDYGFFVLALAFINVLFVAELIFWRAKQRSHQVASLAILAGVVLASLCYGIYRASLYSLEHRLTTVLRDGTTLPDGRAVVTSVNTRVDVANDTGYSIWYRVLRRYGKVGDNSTSIMSSEDENLPPQELKDGEVLECTSDRIPGYLYGGRRYYGEVDCEIAYGRSKSDLSKRFRWQKRITFVLCPVSATLCGPVSYGGGQSVEK